MGMATVTRIGTQTDQDIQRDVLNELKWEPRVQPNEIGVAVKDGVVTLTGWVESYTKKWAAEEAAHRVRGVLAVANDIEVRLPSSAERTDADIAAAAIRALEWDAFVPVDRLDVTVSKGWVTLRGAADADGGAGENRAGARAECGAGRAADHGGGAGEQGHPEGDGARVGGERRGGAGGVVGAGGHLGGEPNHDLLVNRASSTVPGGSSLTTRSGSRSLADVARCKGDVRQQRVSP